MNVLIMLLFGAGIGAGLLLLIQALTPVSEPMQRVFDAVDEPGTGYRNANRSQAFSPRDAVVRLGTAMTLGLGDEVRIRKDLAVTGSSIEQHAIVKAAAPALTLLGCYAFWLATLLVGVDLVAGWAMTLIAIVAGCLAFVIPDIRLRRRANEARVGFRHALSAYLDLVTIIMSGGGGLLTALQTAADSGDGWAFAEIRGALDRARLSNRTPWSQLGVLGERFDIPELRDLVSAAELAGSEGSRISESVATKSDVLRARLQAEVEQTSESLTEQMLLPVGLLLVALFLFLGFAVVRQLGGGNTNPSVEQQVGFAVLSSHEGHLWS